MPHNINFTREDKIKRTSYISHEVNVMGHSKTMYSHSYLGLGLMAAREAIFKYDDPVESKALGSSCILTDTPTDREFHGLKYVISSVNPGYETCMQEVRAVIS